MIQQLPEQSVIRRSALSIYSDGGSKWVRGELSELRLQCDERAGTARISVIVAYGVNAGIEIPHWHALYFGLQCLKARQKLRLLGVGDPDPTCKPGLVDFYVPTLPHWQGALLPHDLRVDPICSGVVALQAAGADCASAVVMVGEPDLNRLIDFLLAIHPATTAGWPN